MRNIVTIAILPLCLCAHAQTGVVAMRDAFYCVSKQKAKTTVLRNNIESSKDAPQTVVMAYTGMYHMLAARDFINPIAKWNSFRKGKNLLDNAIEKDATNPEIRLLRLSAQLSVPSFLGYNNNIEADKRVLLNTRDAITDKDLKQRIDKFITEQGLIAENS